MRYLQLLATDKANSLECWITWDEGAQVWELWSDSNCQGYIGCADDRQEAQKIAFSWFQEFTYDDLGVNTRNTFNTQV